MASFGAIMASPHPETTVISARLGLTLWARLAQFVRALGQWSKGPWFETRIGQWPYFEPHYHQLVRWCQYNVTMYQQPLICISVGGRKATTDKHKKLTLSKALKMLLAAINLNWMQPQLFFPLYELPSIQKRWWKDIKDPLELRLLFWPNGRQWCFPHLFFKDLLKHKLNLNLELQVTFFFFIVHVCYAFFPVLAQCIYGFL
jgi:hypothetical protein